MIELTFTRGQTAGDHVRIRSGVVDVSLSPPAPGDGAPPHALLCFAVESLFGLEGFLRRVGAGIQSDRAQLAVSLECAQAGAMVEALTNLLRSGPPSAPEAIPRLLETIREGCLRRAVGEPSLTVHCAERVRSLALELTARWSELQPGESITLTMPDVRRRVSSPDVLRATPPPTDERPYAPSRPAALPPRL